MSGDLGDLVELVSCSDPYTRLEPGARGVVRLVDDVGTVHVAWRDGSSLGLVQGEDDWRVVLERAELEQLADALVAYAELVQENVDGDRMRDHEAELDGEPTEGGVSGRSSRTADADRVALGSLPLHELTVEVLRDKSGAAALVDEPAGYLELVERLLGKAAS